MKQICTATLACLLALSLSACGTAAATPTPSSVAIDTALSREKATAAVAQIPESGRNCRIIAVVGAPIAAPHLEDPKIQQTAGRARLASFGSGAHDGERVLEGTVLATIVGKLPSGELLANHHLLFAEGSLRTQNDVVSLTPTPDPCVFASKVKVLFHDGTGELAHLSGEGTAEATLNFCGGVGRAVIYGRVCEPK